MQNITPTNNAESLRLNQENMRKAEEEARKHELSSRVYQKFHALKNLKEQEIAQNQQDKIDSAERQIAPGSGHLKDFNKKSASTMKTLPLAGGLASLPWTAKQSLLNLGWANKDSSLYHLSNTDKTMGSLVKNGMNFPGMENLVRSGVWAKNLVHMGLPMGSALTSGLIEAKRSREIRSHRHDKKLSGAATAQRSGALASVISNAMTAPIALKGLRQLPGIGGAAGAAGDLGAMGTLGLTKGIGKALSLGSNFGLGVAAKGGAAATGAAGAGAGGAAGAAGAFLTPALIHTIIGGFVLALPGIVASMAGSRAESNRKKLVAVRNHPSKFIKEYSSAGFVDQVMPRLLALKQVSPSDQVKISLLRLIADSVSPIPKMTEILDYQEQQREKEVKASKKSVSGIGKLSEEATLKEKIGLGLDRLAIKAQKITSHNPFTQLMTLLFEGKTPHEIKQELEKSEFYLDSKIKKEEEFKKSSDLTGLSVQFLTLLSTSSNQILKMSSGPESTQILLLSGMYDLIRGYVGNWINDKKQINKNGMKVFEEKKEEKFKKEEGNMFQHIPGLASIYSLGNLDSVKLGGRLLNTLYSKIVKKIPIIGGVNRNFDDDFKKYGDEKKKKWGDRVTKYIKNPLKKWGNKDVPDSEVLATGLGYLKTQEEKIKKYQEAGLPDDMQTIIYYMKEQLNTLENAFELSKVLLHKLTGESYSKQNIIDTQKKHFDFISGKSITENEFDTLTKERKTAVSSKFSEKLNEKGQLNPDYTKESLNDIKSNTIYPFLATLGTIIAASFGAVSIPLIIATAATSVITAAVTGKNRIQNAPIGNKLNWLEKLKKLKNDPNRSNLNAQMTSSTMGSDEVDTLVGKDAKIDTLFKDNEYKPESAFGSSPVVHPVVPPSFNQSIAKKLKDIYEILDYIEDDLTNHPIHGSSNIKTVLDEIKNLLSSTASPINTSLGTINSSLGTLNSPTSPINISLTAINTSLRTLNSPASPINTSLGTINSSITSLNSPASPINTSLGTINSSIGSLNSSLGIINASLIALKGIEEDPQNILLKDIKDFTESSAASLTSLVADGYNNSPETATGTTNRQFGGPISAGKKYTVGEVGPELFIPKSRQFAKGGQITAPKKPHLVGEKGPEAFIPNTPGKIVPYDELKDILKSKNESYSNTSSKDVLNIINQERKDRKDEEFKKIIIDPKTGHLPEIIEILKTISENNEKYSKITDETNPSSTRTASMELIENEQIKKNEKQEKFENDIVEPRKGYLATIIELLKVNNKAPIIGENKKPEEKDGVLGFISGLFSGGISEFIPNLLKSIIPLAIPAVIAAIFTTSVLPSIREGMGKLFGNGENKNPTPESDAATKGVITTGVAGLNIGANKGIGALSRLAGGATEAGAAGLAGAAGTGAAGLAGAAGTGAVGLAEGIGSKILNFGKNLGLKGAAKTLGVIAKAAPFIGLGTGIYFAWDRLQKGDIDGAWMELGAGAASMIPIYGTMASLTMTAFLLARDLGKEHEAEALMKLKESLSPEVDKLVGGNIDNYAQLVKDHVIIYDENTKLWVLSDPSNNPNATKAPEIINNLDVSNTNPSINPPSPNIPNKENISELRNTKDPESTYDPSKQLKNTISTVTGIDAKTIQEKTDEFNKKTGIVEAGQNLSNTTGNAIGSSAEWVKDTVTGDNDLTKTGKWGLETGGKILAGTANIAADTVAGTQKMLTKDPNKISVPNPTSPNLPTINADIKTPDGSTILTGNSPDPLKFSIPSPTPPTNTDIKTPERFGINPSNGSTILTDNSPDPLKFSIPSPTPPTKEENIYRGKINNTPSPPSLDIDEENRYVDYMMNSNPTHKNLNPTQNQKMTEFIKKQFRNLSPDDRQKMNEFIKAKNKKDGSSPIGGASLPAFATGGYTGKENENNKDGFPAIVHPNEVILPLDDPKTKDYLFDALLGPDERNSNEKYSDRGTLNRIKSLGNEPEDPLNNRRRKSELTETQNKNKQNSSIYSTSNYRSDMKKFKATSFSLPSNDPMENYYSNLNESNINTPTIHPAFDSSISDPRKSISVANTADLSKNRLSSSIDNFASPFKSGLGFFGNSNLNKFQTTISGANKLDSSGRRIRNLNYRSPSNQLDFSQGRLGSTLRELPEELDNTSTTELNKQNFAVQNNQNQQKQQLQPIVIAPTTNTNTTNQAPRTERHIESSERINKIIDKIFPNAITSFEYAITSFALGQSPFAVSR